MIEGDGGCSSWVLRLVRVADLCSSWPESVSEVAVAVNGLDDGVRALHESSEDSGLPRGS